MKILAVEFSTSRRSVALAETLADGTMTIGAEATESNGRSVKALTMIDRAIRGAGWERDAIECVVVGLGPGSYAGVRAAISLAQGWQLAREVQTIGISSMDALAESASNVQGVVRFAIDAHRNEFYTATYDFGENRHRPVEALRIVSAREVVDFLAKGEEVFGPDLETLLAKGSINLFPTATALARLAMRAVPSVAADQLQPIYLRETSFVKAAPQLFGQQG